MIYEKSIALDVLKRSFTILIVLAFLMTAIFSARHSIIYGRAPAFVILIDIASFIRPLMISICVAVFVHYISTFRPSLIGMAASLIYFSLAVLIILYGANKIGLTQYVGNEAVFLDGQVTVLGMLVFFVDHAIIGAAIFIASVYFLSPIFRLETDMG